MGFVAVKLNSEENMGEIYMSRARLSRSSIGSALIEFALDRMKDANSKS